MSRHRIALTALLLVVGIVEASLLTTRAGEPVADPSTHAIYLTKQWSHKTGIFDESAAEIVAYDETSRALFVTNAFAKKVDVLDVSSGTKLGEIDVAKLGSPNSVSARKGLVAVAVEAEPVTDPGHVVFFQVNRASDGFAAERVKIVQVGAQPDMLTFSPDDRHVLVANEGEPEAGVDPEGSVSIIDLTHGVKRASVKTADFRAFNGREEELRRRGVRIFPSRAAAVDLEPECVAVSPDGTTAFVTLQEANAFAIVDVATAAVKDILPAGQKDFSRGNPVVESYPFEELPHLEGRTPGGQRLRLGGFSGLSYVGRDPRTGEQRFVAVPGRGPTAAPFLKDVGGAPGPETVRPFALPAYQARFVHLALDEAKARIRITKQTLLTRRAGDGFMPITGMPNLVFDKDGNQVDDYPVDLSGAGLPLDPFGGDLEGVVVAPDGFFWAVDAYRPAIYQFDANGVLVRRLVPEGTAATAGKPVGTFGLETLPLDYLAGRRGRGFGAIALDAANGTIYAILRTPLPDRNRATSDPASVIRILTVDPRNGRPRAEYVYLLEDSRFHAGKVDTIGDAVHLGGGKLLVIERDASIAPCAKKFIFEINLKGATDVLRNAPLLPGKTLEQHTVDELVKQGIHPVHKRKVLNLPSIGYLAGAKPEGLALLPDGRLAVLDDNDFGVTDDPVFKDRTGKPLTRGTVILRPKPEPQVLGIISFPRGNELDASDRDGAINIRNWPVLGMFMSDAIAAFTAGGRTYYVTANEGDYRDEHARIADLALDADAFPDAAVLQKPENIGRLGASRIDGDLDGDGRKEELHVYGGRSFAIWDAFGNLVFDSGAAIERITALRFWRHFNAGSKKNTFDARSGNKGPKPEAVEVGRVGERTYAFVGLEQMSGIVVYDVTHPARPRFVQYVSNRDFRGDPEKGTAGDLGPEGIEFVSAERSPFGWPFLAVSNEVSGTTTLYRIHTGRVATP